MPAQTTEVGYGSELDDFDYDAQGDAAAYGGSEWDNSAPVGESDYSDPITVLEASTRAPINLNGMESGRGQAGPLSNEDFERVQGGIHGDGITELDASRLVKRSDPNAGDQIREAWQAPCALTTTELEAHKAQMAADAEAAKRSKMIHLALAAGAGFLLSRFMR
jgi:hypothetical protein